MKAFITTKHLNSIDTLRGIAALMVVFFHFLLPHRFPSEMAPQLASYGHLGVQIFFVISGFVIPYSMYLNNYKLKSVGRFMSKRLARLEPPYIASIVITIVLAYVSTVSPYYRGEPYSIDLPQVFSHFAYVNIFLGYDWINPVYWTLAIEFQYYILVALLYQFILSHKPAILLCVLFGVLAIAIPEKNLIFLHAPFFICGIALFLLKVEKISLWNAAIVIAANLLLIACVHSLSYVIVGAFTVMAIVYLNNEWSVAAFLGSISYSVYLLHVPIGQRMLNLSENFIEDEYIMACMVVVVTLVIIFISTLFSRWIERPSHKWSRKINI